MAFFCIGPEWSIALWCVVVRIQKKKTEFRKRSPTIMHFLVLLSHSTYTMMAFTTLGAVAASHAVVVGLRSEFMASAVSDASKQLYGYLLNHKQYPELKRKLAKVEVHTCIPFIMSNSVL